VQKAGSKMEAKTVKLEELFFPVRAVPALAQLENKVIPVSGKKVLVNSDTNNPISIISSDYEICTNREAYEKIEVFNIISPLTRSFCHIDLITPEKRFRVGNDEFQPFVRVTNSYNRMFKLYFRIGVCRSICKNGVIFDEDSIEFSYNHVRGARKTLDFKIKTDAMKKILDRFKEDVEILMEHNCEGKYLFPMFRKALALNAKKEESEVQQNGQLRFDEVESSFFNLLGKYSAELGENYYALYNAITDIATRGFNDERLISMRIHRRQARAGMWIREISDMLRNGKIDYSEYLRDYLEVSKN
jgi:hypothetical protein